MNRLADETSPYLRQHRDNPVDWYPWGDEAFAAARERDVPVLLSVGYSSCHWCHVMAHESFEDDATAEVMNRLFVNVKIDREERPDVDAVYMEAVQAMTGHGGWPMTVFVTPEGEPFFAGTYFPKDRRQNMPAFVEVLQAVDDAWRNRRSEVEEQAGQIAESIRARTTLPEVDGAPAISPVLLDRAMAALVQAHDDQRGGFGGAPKFPQPSMIDLVLRGHAAAPSDVTTRLVTTTLDAMASGGIYDHLGGGFARYSVDAGWTVPHFEKMLYDQAGLGRVYLHAWQATGEARWLQVLEETIGYVLRDLRGGHGGIASAEDADSEGVEGKFYVWSEDEIRDVLGDAAPAAIAWYGVTPAGNFEGANILHRPVRGDLIRPPEIEAARQGLLEARGGRVRPGLDDKVLTEWNAMFVSLLAEAGAATGRADWIDAAAETADFLLAELRDDRGVWLRSWQGGRARHLAYAADHAWLVDAFTRLAEATGQPRWIDEARSVARTTITRFWDHTSAGLFTTAHDAEKLIVRSRELMDGATPSASAVAAVAFLRLAALTGDDDLRGRGEEIVALLAPFLAEHPLAFTHALAAVDLLVRGPIEIVVPGTDEGSERLVRAAQRRWLPTAVFAWGDPYDSPLWEGRVAGHAYVCRNYACRQPVSDEAALLAQLG